MIVSSHGLFKLTGYLALKRVYIRLFNDGKDSTSVSFPLQPLKPHNARTRARARPRPQSYDYRRQDDSKNANNERKQRCDFVMVGLNERVSDPIPITPDRIEHGRTLFFIALFCVLLVVLKQPNFRVEAKLHDKKGRLQCGRPSSDGRFAKKISKRRSRSPRTGS